MTGAPKIGKRAFVQRLALYAADRLAFDSIVRISFGDIDIFRDYVGNNDQNVLTLDMLIEYVFWFIDSQGGFYPRKIDLSWHGQQPINRTVLLQSLLLGELERPDQDQSRRDRQWLFVLDECDRICDKDVLAQLVNKLMRGSDRPGSINVVMTARESIVLKINGVKIDGALEIPLEGIVFHPSTHTSHCH